MLQVLPRAFYEDPDVVQLAKALLGKGLWTQSPEGIVSGGRIVETEAYAGETDRASHAFGGRRTRRTEVMYGPAGTAYVYLVYGLHHLFNVVTYREGVPHAVLIRGLEPLAGTEAMLTRRNLGAPTAQLTAGPARLSQALGITIADNGRPLDGDRVWLTEGQAVPPACIEMGPRIGVAYAGEDAFRPYRFWVKGSPWVSRAKQAAPGL